MLKYQQAKQQVLKKVYKLSPGQPFAASKDFDKRTGLQPDYAETSF